MNPGQINDAYIIINEMAAQMLGSQTIRAVDSTSFVAVGQLILKTGYESTLNSLGVVLSRTVFSIRPYRMKLGSMYVTPEKYGAITRKIIPLYTETEESRDWNTIQNPSQLADGQSVDHYKIKNPKMIQLNFYGQQALQKHITRYDTQLDQAFRSEEEFMRFIGMVMTEFNNEIEVANESRTRALMNNCITAVYSYGNAQTVDVIAGFNEEKGTSYTREQIIGEHISDFMKYMAADVKIWSERLTDYGYQYHINLTQAKIPRHTPKDRQKMIMYNPLFIRAESEVYSELFNEKYLDIGRFEGVNYWQSPNDPTRIIFKPTVLNTTTGAQEASAANVDIPYVLGILYDSEFMGVSPIFEKAISTPLNAAGRYWNLYYHWLFSNYCDLTENAIVFVLGPGAVTPPTPPTEQNDPGVEVEGE